LLQGADGGVAAEMQACLGGGLPKGAAAEVNRSLPVGRDAMSLRKVSSEGAEVQINTTARPT